MWVCVRREDTHVIVYSSLTTSTVKVSVVDLLDANRFGYDAFRGRGSPN